MRKLLVFPLLIPLLVFANPRIVIKHPWVQEPPPGPNTTMAGMVIENEGDTEDALLGVKSDIAKKVEIHKTVFENGVAKMVHQKEVVIPPHSEVEFKHHGYHIMLIGLKKALKVGEKVKLVLIFKRSGRIEVWAPVVKKPMMMHSKER